MTPYMDRALGHLSGEIDALAKRPPYSHANPNREWLELTNTICRIAEEFWDAAVDHDNGNDQRIRDALQTEPLKTVLFDFLAVLRETDFMLPDDELEELGLQLEP